MKYSKTIINFADNLISYYSKYDILSDCYNISTSNIPDFDLHEFSSLLMLEDSDRASEATGPDNKYFETKMLPSLIKFMENTTDKDNQIEYIKSWRDGITNYFESTIESILSDRLENYNHTKKYEVKCA